ncbi:restriction endonuclease subunit S [Lactococcus sp. dk322]|nr:restriction endonuclease subunit S [Lactococcus sp. dk101]TXK38125.1 restriction endonuclease subunit S [Lactococcus sp. dk310]TXK49803.1 restriction endonuclease subunit S [Lactococcus sp. dk322]
MDTKALREKILDLAMRGKLVPQDPNDEPASELLKRIKAEKEELIKQKKIKRDKNETEIFRGDDNLHYEKFADGSLKMIEVPYEVPESWQWVRIRNIANIIAGGTPKTSVPEYYGGSIAWITPAEMGKKQKNMLFENPQRHITDLGLQKSSAQLVSKNSVVYSKRAPIGHINIVPFEYSTNQGCLSFESILVDSNFYYFEIKNVKADIENRASGTTFKEISATAFSDTLVILPPIAEQKRIVAVANELLAIVDKIESEQKDLKNLSTQLKKKVLDIAMQGKLVPQDPNDEPASVLLEKIRAEKQKLFEEGKLKKKDLEEITPVNAEDNAYYGKLPKTWSLTTLGNIGTWISGATPKKARKDYYQNGSIPWLKTGDLNDGYIHEIPDFITELALVETSVKIIPRNTVVIAMYGATIGKLGITTFETTSNQACCACLNVSEVDKNFLFYYLLSYRKQFIDSAFGGAQPNISKEKIVITPFVLPPVREQLRIIGSLTKFESIIHQFVQ